MAHSNMFLKMNEDSIPSSAMIDLNVSKDIEKGDERISCKQINAPFVVVTNKNQTIFMNSAIEVQK